MSENRRLDQTKEKKQRRGTNVRAMRRSLNTREGATRRGESN